MHCITPVPNIWVSQVSIIGEEAENQQRLSRRELRRLFLFFKSLLNYSWRTLVRRTPRSGGNRSQVQKTVSSVLYSNFNQIGCAVLYLSRFQKVRTRVPSPWRFWSTFQIRSPVDPRLQLKYHHIWAGIHYHVLQEV